MNAKKLCTRALTVLLVMLMVVGMLPMSVLAVTKVDPLEASLKEAKSYIDGITINNSSNDPYTVVSKFGTHFTWDNEKRENSKSYLFDWSYYNGVVFEGIEYLYEVTGDTAYADYVKEYMSTMIASNGTWAKCANNSGKEAAGYNAAHGADCYKTASLLLDLYEMTGEKRYLTMAATLYADLDTAAKSYSLKNAGNNYRHTWSSDPSPDLWLDGLYMILPFRAEYAAYTNDQEELDLIVDRMQWVSDNMYNSGKKLFYHAADSATSNSGSYWLRAIGWYAAAIVDVMDSMEGENLEAMQAQLKKLVDGMKACQNTSNGMWLNNMNASKSSTNPYETSGTALVCYAIMKAVNNGWLDESYADMAILAFNGICNEKLNGSNLTDICFKGAPGSGNSTFYDNEGKGVGPFIMFYAEVLEYYNASRRVVFEDEYLQITATGVGLTAIDAKDVADEVEDKIASVIDTEEFYVAYDVEITAYNNFETVTYTMDIMDGMSTTDLVLYHLADDGTLTPMNALMAAETEDYLAYLTFTTNTDGIFVYGTKYVEVEEDAVLTELKIESAPTVNAYFKTEEDDEPALDITGLVVKATFNDGTEKTIDWNEFGEALDGYALTFDMTQVGEQDVTVSYTYGEVTKTATFKITVFDTEIKNEEAGITIAPSAPGVTEVKVENNSEDETVKNALRGKVTTFTSYDIDLVGYTQGDSVVVTLPIPEGTVNPVVYYVPDDGSAAQKLDAYIYDDVVVFVTDHFTTYAVGDDVGIVAEEGKTVTGYIAGTKKYELATNGITAGKDYLIVNTDANGTGYALTNNNTDNGTKTEVNISNGIINVEDSAATNIAWTFSDDESGTINNGTRYVLGNNKLTHTSSRTVTIIERNSGAYRIYYTQTGMRTTYYYVSYTNGNWSRSTTNSSNNVASVYLYEYTETVPGAPVTFSVTPSSATIKPGDKLDLTGTVTVAGNTVDLSKCTITWASSDRTKATVTDGTVTGVAVGTANITATLSVANEEALQENIVLTIPVTVQNKAIVDSELIGGPVKVATGKEVDYSKVSLKVTYEDNTEGTIDHTQLTFGDVDTSTNGTKTVEVTYGGKTYNLEVIVSPYGDLEEATEYPEYPNPGAVRIDKTAKERDFEDTGIVEVELDVAGISYKTGVDVVLTIDISNSMCWETGTSNKQYVEDNKLTEVMAAVKTFAGIFLEDSDNTITIVTFAGYDAEHWNSTANAHIDSVRTLVTATNSIDVVNAIADGTKFTAADTIQIAYIPADADQNNVSNVAIDKSASGKNRGDTNYDYGFWQTNQAVINGNLGAGDRNVYVLFMTDGCASNYNNIYYRSSNVGYYDCPGTNTPYTYNTNFANSTGTAWTNYIENTLIANNGGNIYAKELYENVDDIYAVGFDMAHGSFSGIGTWDENEEWNVIFNHIVSKSVVDENGNGLITVTDASDTETLNKFYSGLAEDLKLAGTNAQANDVIGSKFTLQMAAKSGTEGDGQGLVDLSAHGITPSITIKAYDLYLKSETDDVELIGTRKGTYEEIEIVTFSEDGTKAYSNEIGAGVNIMSVANGVTTIKAEYFTYTKNAEGVEEFDWYIGDITDKEIAFSFFAYLKGALEGDAPKEAYYTNEEATLEYIDAYNKHATQIFPNPKVVWGGASTSYEYYLVNSDGLPCNRQGQVVPFANRIVIAGPYYQEMFLNDENFYDMEIVQGVDELPEGYALYDPSASYEVQTASGTHDGYLTIKGDATKIHATRIVSYTGDDTPDDESDDTYIQSRVAFGVIVPQKTVIELTPERVVIDYGKPIVVNVTEGEKELHNSAGVKYAATLIGFTAYNKSVDLQQVYPTFVCENAYDGAYGKFTINTDSGEPQAQYTPVALVNGVDSVFSVVKLQNPDNEEDFFFMLEELTVIPATFVYYETDFADGVFTYSATGWRANPMNDNTYTSETNKNPDGPQDYKKIGTDLYGFDNSYTNDTWLSDGLSEFAEGEGVDKTYTTFTFTGTGFDLISRTGTEQGMIKVVVTDEDGNVVKTISVLNKSESNLTLYQIPVVSINGLDHGTYTVKISVDKGFENKTGNSALDFLYRGNEFYFDAIRIYDPIDVSDAASADASTATKLAFNAYVADGEANNVITEVRAKLVAATEFNPMGGTGIVFVDRINDASGETGADLETYKTIGPNNEVYLAGEQTIGFKLVVDADEIPASIQLGAKSADGNPVELNVVVSNGTTPVNVFSKDISTSTSMYYDILGGKTLTSGGEYIIIVSNPGDGVLSITDFKVAYGNNVVSEVEIISDEETLTEVVKYVQKRIGVEEEAANYDVISAEFAVDSVKFNTDVTMVITTSEKVESIEIQNQNGRATKFTVESVVTVDGVKVWTVTMKINAFGTRTFTATGYSADGLAGASAEASIEVTLF